MMDTTKESINDHQRPPHLTVSTDFQRQTATFERASLGGTVSTPVPISTPLYPTPSSTLPLPSLLRRSSPSNVTDSKHLSDFYPIPSRDPKHDVVGIRPDNPKMSAMAGYGDWVRPEYQQHPYAITSQGPHPPALVKRSLQSDQERQAHSASSSVASSTLHGAVSEVISSNSGGSVSSSPDNDAPQQLRSGSSYNMTSGMTWAHTSSDFPNSSMLSSSGYELPPRHDLSHSAMSSPPNPNATLATPYHLQPDYVSYHSSPRNHQPHSQHDLPLSPPHPPQQRSVHAADASHTRTATLMQDEQPASAYQQYQYAYLPSHLHPNAVTPASDYPTSQTPASVPVVSPIPPSVPRSRSAEDELHLMRARVRELEHLNDSSRLRIRQLEDEILHPSASASSPPVVHSSTTPTASMKMTTNLSSPDEDMMGVDFTSSWRARYEARIRLFCSLNRAGNALCAWHDSRRERRAYPPRMAPPETMNCGCTYDEALFEESLARHMVGSYHPGENVRMDPALRNPLLKLLQERFGYHDGDFERDHSTGQWLEGEGHLLWEAKVQASQAGSSRRGR